ncbi:MAG: domain S-box [Segetibacter sp.]|nr:domain S-box [Segetibacter sp.]
MNDKYRILHLEDVSTDAELVARELKKNNISFEHLVIDCKKDYIEALDQFCPDIVLCGHSLRSFNSLEAISIIKAKMLCIPFILITATLTEEVAVRVVKEGADDYIFKDTLKRLPNALINAIEKYRFEKERTQLIDEVLEKETLLKELLGQLSNKLLLATSVAGIGIWEYCLSDNKFIGDDVLFSLYGITSADFDGSYKMWMQFVHPDDKERVKQEIQDTFLKYADFDTEFRIVWNDGSIHSIKAVALVQRDAARNPTRLIGTNQDISSQKKAEQVVRESEAKYRSFFENSMDGILLTMPYGGIAEANPAACTIFQMTQEEICNSGKFGLIDLTDPASKSLIEERNRTGKAKGELTFIRKDGSRFLGEFTSGIFKDALGNEITSTIIRDITERKQAEQKLISTSGALRKALNDVEKIMDSSLDVICSIGEEGRFVSVSSASEHIWGYKPSELTGKRYMDMVFAEDAAHTIDVAEGIVSGVPVTMFENRYVRKDGSIVPLLWSARWDDNDKLMYCIAKDATEKKRLEKAFESERQRLYDLFLHAPSCIGVLKGPNHVFETANPLYLQLIGKTDIIGKPLKEVLPEAAEQGFIELLDTVYKTDKTFVANERLIKLDPNGNGEFVHKYLNFICQSNKNTAGIIEGIFFFAIDVTEQVEARHKIEDSEKRFRQIVETAQEGIWMIDENCKTVFVNQKMCDMLEYSQEEMIGRTNLSFKDEEGQQSSLQFLEKRKMGINESHESKFLTKSGKYIWTYVSTNPIFDEEGAYKGALGMITNITERKLAEEKLRENQEQLLESQRIAHIGSWQLNFSNSTDINSNPIYCSEETYRIFGLQPDTAEVSYHLFSKFIYSEDRELVKASLEKSIEENSSYSIDFRIVHRNGSKKWVCQQAKVVTDDASGKPLKMFGTIKDITIRKEQELQLQKNTEERDILIAELTKSIKDLKQFTYITSHNFRAPLSNLIGLLSLVDYNTLETGNKEIVEMFKASTLQLNKTINDLIQILIIKNNVNVNTTNNSINESVDEAHTSLSHEINETGCIINKDLQVEKIYFNRSYLESILINLLSNAIKYRSPDRPLQIDISTKPKSNGDVLMIIKDNGIGIDLNRHRDSIFGLYQRFHTNPDSVGLGLFIVKTQINALGGEIDVESKIDKGTTFYITFKEKPR